MPLNNLDFIVFDLETSGLDPTRHDAIEVAAKAYDCRTLEPYPADRGGEFQSLMRPLRPENIDDAALRVNNITREMLLGDPAAGLEPAPDQGVVWRQFVDWVAGFNRKKTPFGAPIACGKNIRNFDMLFVRELNARHAKKKEKTVLFSKRLQVDLDDLVLLWFENDDLPDMRMDTLRPYFGLSSEGAHRAMVDVRQTGALIMKFLKLKRELRARRAKDGGPLIQFEGCMKGVQL